MSKSNSNLLNALQEAKDRGFMHDLFLHDGEFVTVHDEVVPPLIIEITQCPHCYATLYCVAGEDVRGTWVHHWD